MPKALQQTQDTQGSEHASSVAHSLRSKVSDHVAWGLLVYTGLHIFLTMTQLKSGSGSLLPYFALIVLVVAIIPACRWLEKRWEDLTEADSDEGALEPAFRREMVLLWMMAMGLPIMLTLGFKAASALF